MSGHGLIQAGRPVRAVGEVVGFAHAAERRDGLSEVALLGVLAGDRLIGALKLAEREAGRGVAMADQASIAQANSG